MTFARDKCVLQRLYTSLLYTPVFFYRWNIYTSWKKMRTSVESDEKYRFI